jgi:hypothetical protein
MDGSDLMAKRKLPKSARIDRSMLPPITDQGELNSSAASAVSISISAKLDKKRRPKRLFIYYHERTNT